MTRVYFNWGRWVADCPTPDCAGAEHYGDRLTDAMFACSYCHTVDVADWPAERDGIEAILKLRPVPSTQNWFPADHELAIRANTKHGESVADLEAENEQHGVRPRGEAA